MASKTLALRQGGSGLIGSLVVLSSWLLLKTLEWAEGVGVPPPLFARGEVTRALEHPGTGGFKGHGLLHDCSGEGTLREAKQECADFITTQARGGPGCCTLTQGRALEVLRNPKLLGLSQSPV